MKFKDSNNDFRSIIVTRRELIVRTWKFQLLFIFSFLNTEMVLKYFNKCLVFFFFWGIKLPSKYIFLYLSILYGFSPSCSMLYRSYIPGNIVFLSQAKSSRGRFPVGLFSIKVFIIDSYLLHAYPAHFSLLKDISLIK